MRPVDNFFLQKEEPVKGSLLFLRQYILDFNKEISEEWKYGMPFYYYRGKMFCYLWVHKKLKHPYIGIVEGKKINHPSLIQEGRARMKIMLLDPSRDLPLRTIQTVLNKALKYY